MHATSIIVFPSPPDSKTEMEAPPVTVMPVTGGTINMMEYLLQGELRHKYRLLRTEDETSQ